QGNGPLGISVYYSSTADGASPVYDHDRTTSLAYDLQNTISFQYMRCTNGEWIPYISEVDYLAENDPSGDPSSWIAYNNIFC
ncbi:hypothetical protein PFISCL1PPCAC_25035, partial [Pristionchus fissidentatus]